MTTGDKKTASLVTLGCKANQFESEAMREQLEAAGYRIRPFEAGAELVVVNSCTVTAATDAQTRKLVRRARRLNADCRIVVTGCAAQVQPDMFRDLPGVVHVLGNMEKERLIDILRGDGPCVQVGDIRQAKQCPDLTISSFTQHSRAFVQIQSGCDAFCSYCIIPFARGPSRSVAVDRVVDQVQLLVAAGYAEVVLTGIHIGRYGRDLETPTDLVGLLDQLLARTSVERLRLGSVEPQEISAPLIELLATSSRLCRHLHIPLQSGCDHILERMNRHYRAEEFCLLVACLKQRFPDLGIGLDVMTGFPGESAEAFEQTFALLEALPFSYLHAFPYSARPGTVAASLGGRVDGAVARQRAERLRVLAQKKKQLFLQQFMDQKVDVVFEQRPLAFAGEKKWRDAAANGDLWPGLTGEYLPLVCSSAVPLGGLCRAVQVVGCDGERLIGTCC